MATEQGAPFEAIQGQFVERVTALRQEPSAHNLSQLLGLFGGLHVSGTEAQEAISRTYIFDPHYARPFVFPRLESKNHAASLWNKNLSSGLVQVLDDGYINIELLTEEWVDPYPHDTSFYKPKPYPYRNGRTALVFDDAGRFIRADVGIDNFLYDLSINREGRVAANKRFTGVAVGDRINFAGLLDLFSTPANWQAKPGSQSAELLKGLIVTAGN